MCPLGVPCSCTPFRWGVTACHCSTEGLHNRGWLPASLMLLRLLVKDWAIQEKQWGRKRRAFHSREEQTVGIVTNSLSHCAIELSPLSVLFKHLLNEPVSAFVLTPYLRVQSSAELQNWEWWKKLLVVETVNWIAQLENIFEFLVRCLWWLKHQRMGGREGKFCLIPLSQCPDGHAA